MPTPSDELRAFHQYLGERLSNGGADLSPEEALDEWRILHPDHEADVEDLAAIKEGLADLAAGRVRPAREVLQELAQKYNLPQLMGD